MSTWTPILAGAIFFHAVCPSSRYFTPNWFQATTSSAAGPAGTPSAKVLSARALTVWNVTSTNAPGWSARAPVVRRSTLTRRPVTRSQSVAGVTSVHVSPLCSQTAPVRSPLQVSAQAVGVAVTSVRTVAPAGADTLSDPGTTRGR